MDFVSNWYQDRLLSIGASACSGDKVSVKSTCAREIHKHQRDASKIASQDPGNHCLDSLDRLRQHDNMCTGKGQNAG